MMCWHPSDLVLLLFPLMLTPSLRRYGCTSLLRPTLPNSKSTVPLTSVCHHGLIDWGRMEWGGGKAGEAGRVGEGLDGGWAWVV